MDATAKKDWLEALRSGEYTQGHGQLCDRHGRMCCLGVFIDACVNGEWVLDETASGYRFNGAMGTLPNILREAIGLDMADEGELINMNDKEAKSFTQIADWIEENL